MSAHTIHHVTAVTANVQRNLDFYTETLGLRLVKRTVNQDDVSAYHLFYADALGTPGTDITFFGWPDSRPAASGAGTVRLTSFRVPDASLPFWEERLTALHPLMEEDEAGRARLLFTDPEGQPLELVAADDLPLQAEPWSRAVPGENAIRGILGADLESARPQATRRILHEILGYGTDDGDVFWTGDDNNTARIRVVEPRRGVMGRPGAGGVHHIAFRVTDDDELMSLKERLDSVGLQNSGRIDRFYFHSVYFREPGGILFELATEGPGFASDEPIDSLGEHLALPPFLEDRREEIEAGLSPLSYPSVK